MRPLFRLVINISGYESVLNRFIVLSLESLSEERNMIVAEKFIRSFVQKYGKHTVYTDGGTWYPAACNILRLKHYVHSPLEKSLMERVNQYFKDRIESFDDYHSCIRNECNLFHVYNWIQFFVSMYNSVTTTGNEFNFEFNGGEVIST